MRKNHNMNTITSKVKTFWNDNYFLIAFSIMFVSFMVIYL